MPEICRFYGIVIKMFFIDHEPPHFHVEYGEYTAVININTLALITGNLPPRALGLVCEWTSIHKEELIKLWDRAKIGQPLYKITPLD